MCVVRGGSHLDVRRDCQIPQELELQVDVSCLVWMLRSKPDLLGQYQVPLPAEPSLWPCVTFF